MKRKWKGERDKITKGRWRGERDGGGTEVDLNTLMVASICTNTNTWFCWQYHLLMKPSSSAISCFSCSAHVHEA